MSLVAAAGPARAASGPPADPYSKGSVTLCGPDGKPVTGGSIYTAPFVWKAVSSLVPPAADDGPFRISGLTVQQVRPGTEPLEWSGAAITADTRYPDPKHPVAQSTRDDLGLSQITNAYPPQGAGYYELRMYFGTVSSGRSSYPYPASMIQVTGTTWRLVRGGGGTCAPTGISSEVYAGTVSTPAPAYAAEVASAQKASTVPASSKKGSSQGTTGASSSTGGNGSTNGGSTSAASSSGSGGHGGSVVTDVAVGVAAAAVVGAAGTVVFMRRRAS